MKYEIMNALQKEINAGEYLLWSGQPTRGIIFRKEDIMRILGILVWLGYVGYQILKEAKTFNGSISLLILMIFSGIGIIGTAVPLITDVMNRGRTYYGLTNTRVLIINTLFGKMDRSLLLDLIPEIALDEKKNRRGTIYFRKEGKKSADKVEKSWFGMKKTHIARFEMIDNARQVYDMILDAQRKKANKDKINHDKKTEEE